METMIEHYGSGLLQIFGGILVFLLWIKLFDGEGMIRQICLQYMNGICG